VERDRRDTMIELNKEKFVIIGCESADADKIVRPNITYWQDAWRRLKKNKVAMVSLGILIIIVLMCIFGEYFVKIKYSFQDTNSRDSLPNAVHWFGTDQLGRDIYARIWHGGRVSIAIGILAAAVVTIIGIIYGGVSGYLGGLADDIMMRIVEVLNGIPYLIIVILLTIILDVKGMIPLVIAMSITGWMGMARLIRGQVLQLKEQEYVLAALALGADTKRVLARHLIPNTIGLIIVSLTFDVPSFIFAEAFLSFLGLGIQPPGTSWGAMASLAQPRMIHYPYQLFFPSIAISLTMLAFNLLGDGLRDALDPKLRQ
jgi:ABC-type dipeptide/oligopeptide/nickel transport systems, permease components